MRTVVTGVVAVAVIAAAVAVGVLAPRSRTQVHRVRATRVPAGSSRG